MEGSVGVEGGGERPVSEWRVVSEWTVVCEGPVSEWRGVSEGQWGVRGQCQRGG